MAKLKSILSFASTSKQPKLRWGSQIPTMRCSHSGQISSSEEEVLRKFDFREYAAAKVKRVNEELELAVPLRHPLRLHESMRYTLLSGGTRAFPLATLASCELVGGVEDAAMPAACAMEMIATTCIISDDLPCIDDGEFRRGRPTNHLAFGEGTAVLAGVSLLAFALEHVAARTSGVPAERVLRAVAELASAMGPQGVMAGQAVDMASEGQDVDLATVDFIHSHKTGILMEAAVASGAILGGGGGEEVERLRRYARSAGLLYQVADDILDATKTAEETGKSVGKDAAKGKATYPKLLGLDGAHDAVRVLLTRARHELSGFDIRRAAPLFHLANNLAKPGAMVD